MTSASASSAIRGPSQIGRFALGIDVGGTKIAAAIVDVESGAIQGRRQIATECRRGGEPVLADVAELAVTLTHEATKLGLQLTGLGVGVAELVSPAGHVFSGYRIAWKGLPVQARLSGLLPTRVESDVRAAAQAEARFGAGQTFRSFLYLTIGTGVSGVLVQDGRPYVGSRGAALVIANGQTRRRCSACGHETAQVLEDVASGPGLAAAYGRHDGAEAVLEAAIAGDRDACSVIDHGATELGSVVALLVNSLDPEAVVVGGGLGTAAGPYWQALTRAIRTGLWDQDDRPLPILQAALGSDAGLIGAALGAAEFGPRHLEQAESKNRPENTRLSKALHERPSQTAGHTTREEM